MLHLKNVIYRILIFFFFSLLISCGPENTPTDQELIRHFQSNRETFKKVLNVFMSEQGLQRVEIHDYGTGLKLWSNLEDVNFNKQELLYDLKQKLKVDLMQVRAFNSVDGTVAEVSFFLYRTGIVSAGRAKGIAYFNYGVPKNIENDLDKYDPPQNKKIANDSGRIYVEIEDGWYLFSEQ